jgi:hypothetical protein
MSSRPLLAALALALCGCDRLFFAELEAPSVCLTLPQVAFPGTAADPALVRDVSYDLAANLPVVGDSSVEYELRLSRMDTTLRAVDPATDPGYTFAAIQSVRILAHDPSGALADVPLVAYQEDPAHPPTDVISASGPMNVDLAPYVRAGTLALRAEYSGGLPRGSFTADVRGCFELRVKLDYGKLLKP